MENLWKKESNEAEAIYIDLFAFQCKDEESKELVDEFAKLNSKPRCKDYQVSMEIRERGNAFFRQQNWSDAMNCYNISLCFAEVNSENVALAYSNRSACFFKMTMYAEALIDIELAKTANVPDRLLPKLKQRQKECEKLMDSMEKPFRRDFKLSYMANKNIPCMADVLKIKYNKNFGRHLVAKCDIPVGRIVLVEKDFIGTRSNDQILCCTCFRKKANYIACTQCPDALFCDTECMDNNFLHKWECGFSMAQFNHNDRFYIQSILLAIESFPDIESLIEFVENILAEDRKTMPTSVCDLKSNYHFFLKLQANKVKSKYLPYNYYKCVISIPKINALIDSEKKKRFLMHLITQHFLITNTNAIKDNQSKSLNNVFSMINHSCAPNLNNYCIGNRIFCETIRYVNKGEQLFINYLGNTESIPTDERQSELNSRWGFVCQCIKCNATHDMTNAHLELDPLFRFTLFNLPDEQKHLEIFEKCREFLNKYGHMTWSRQIEFMTNTFAFLNQELFLKA